VNNANAIRNGALAGKPRFFGSSTAETVSASSGAGSGWNGDYATSVLASQPWFFRGAASSYNGTPGVFAFAEEPGAERYDIGHRTILSGY
jgi:hypothetical protein